MTAQLFDYARSLARLHGSLPDPDAILLLLDWSKRLYPWARKEMQEYCHSCPTELAEEMAWQHDLDWDHPDPIERERIRDGLSLIARNAYKDHYLVYNHGPDVGQYGDHNGA